MIVISDTSVISNLIDIQHLFLLEQLYQKVIVPEAVYRELSVQGESTTEMLAQAWCEVRAIAEQSKFESFQRTTRLDRGESEAILLAQQLNAELLLIDERRGRAEAQRFIKRLMPDTPQARVIEHAREFIDDFISTFGSPERFYASALN